MSEYLSFILQQDSRSSIRDIILFQDFLSSGHLLLLNYASNQEEKININRQKEEAEWNS